MLQPLIDALIPHSCCSCGEIGRPLCESCKYDIVNEPYERCIHCDAPITPGSALCMWRCAQTPYTKVWVVGERRAALKELIDDAKFHSARAAALTLAELLSETLPHLPDGIAVVGVPTVATHIRQRGYDHVALMARSFAQSRHLRYASPLRRVGKAVQHGASRRVRQQQAKTAFQSTSVSGCFLLIDDIFTTGATLHYAAKALKAAGATEVWVAVIARQPLEK